MLLGGQVLRTGAALWKAHRAAWVAGSQPNKVGYLGGMAKKTTNKANQVETTPGPATVEPATTQRAYTLRLRGVEGDTTWRDALWATHETINDGAKAFGDWLLTLRGGLSHELAEPPPAKGKKRTEGETEALRKGRRILLALSWLSVEDERGAPEGLPRAAKGTDSDSEREVKVLAALRAILAARRIGKADIESWVADCGDSLAARIRDDAVWVNRSACFDQKAAKFKGLSHEYATKSVLSFFGPTEDYFSLPSTDADDEGDVAGGGGNDGPEFRTLARQWASTNFGTGEKSDTDTIVHGLRKLADTDLSRFAGSNKLELIAHMSKKLAGPTPDIDGVRIAVGWKTGRPSKGRLAIDTLPDRLTKAAIETMQAKFAEEAESKEGSAGLRDVPRWMPGFRGEIEKACGMPFVGERNHIGEFSVMLDHAARRVSIGHSWIKRAEAERRRFEEDVTRLAKVPATAAKWLDGFIAERSGTSGAAAADGEYRIRRRAIEGWDEVLKRWKRVSCKTEADRIEAARETQADPDIDKFGDIQLFEALAADDAQCVWRQGGKATTDPLRDYVLGHDAKHKRHRFKVPAFRHPDPLRHPVFGDFGNSRWEIAYAVHASAKSAGAKRVPDALKAAWLKDRHGLRMGLWNGDSLGEVSLRWSSKRLADDLAIRQTKQERAVRAVGRADRLGRAAAGMRADETPSAAGLFSLDDWNGRLQAPRAQLDALAERVAKHGWDAKAKTMRDRIKWLISFSAKLECRGPYIAFVRGFAEDAPAKPFVSRKGELAVKHETNDKRQGHAKLVLSRLPGLRILSVDLGHRFAASCVVWESLSAAAFKKETAGRALVAGGTGKSDLYLHTRHTDPKTGKDRTTIYRRIGADTLADGTPHPAPWARLDRQFLIKLQGEERPARAASAGWSRDTETGERIKSDINEVQLVADLAKSIGYLGGDEERSQGCAVDELVRRAVAVATTGLKRHARAAKIAYALNPDNPGLPGMGGSLKPISRGDADHVKFLTTALFDWHALATDTEWDGSQARELWNRHIKPLAAIGFAVEAPRRSDPAAPQSERPTRQQKRKDDEAFRSESIEPIAKALAVAPASTTGTMFTAWKDLWKHADGSHARVPQVPAGQKGPKETKPTSPASGWHAHLRTLTDWVMGWHLDGATSNLWTRNVGGLGLTRITTMRSLYQLHKAFEMRARPDKVQGAPARGEDNSGIARGILTAMERMREQRVKQIASRIVEAALGVGRHIRAGGKDPATGNPFRDAKRPQVQTDPPCHAVVIENLRNYRPDELQTRRENKALMSWSSGKVRKALEEGCQLHGLHLREVQPNYTSRQCSRTGLPGMRCADVPIDDFLASKYWAKVIASARKKLDGKESSEGAALDRLVRDLYEHWSNATGDAKKKQRTLRIPKAGADLFVAAGSVKALQADLNAAANIGLRALLDPDFAGKWWYIPCDTATGRPAKNKCAGSAFHSLDALLSGMVPRQDTEATVNKSKKEMRSGEIANAWRDLTAQPADRTHWMTHGEYWAKVKYRVIQSLRKANGLPD